MVPHAGKKREDIENFINEGVFQVERLKEDGWITKIKYDDEVQRFSFKNFTEILGRENFEERFIFCHI